MTTCLPQSTKNSQLVRFDIILLHFIVSLLRIVFLLTGPRWIVSKYVLDKNKISFCLPHDAETAAASAAAMAVSPNSPGPGCGICLGHSKFIMDTPIACPRGHPAHPRCLGLVPIDTAARHLKYPPYTCIWCRGTCGCCGSELPRNDFKYPCSSCGKDICAQCNGMSNCS